MSGDHNSGDGDASRPRVSLFGRASKPTLSGPAPPPTRPPRKPRRMGLSSLSGLLTFVLLGALATVGALAWLMKEARSPGPLAADKVVMIVREDDGGSIADQLERAGVIDSSMWFNVLTLLDGNRGALKRGEYAFKAGMSMNEIENELIAHRVVRYKFTIPEGLTSEQVVDRLREDTVLAGEIRETPREGSLMPDTYYFERGDTRLSILSRMEKIQAKTVGEIWKGRAPDLPIKSPGELVTLASIVEKETGKPEERPHVAGVFINRLEKHMRLESDPTIVYGLALGKGTLGRSITRADLNQSTPYNTYIIEGLPPGPICNPGKAALEAVAQPSRSKDLYFVADGTGGHAFAETLDQHQKNVAHWRQIEKDVKDKLAPDVAPGPAIRGSIEPVDPAAIWRACRAGTGTSSRLGARSSEQDRRGPEHEGCGACVACRCRRQVEQGNERRLDGGRCVHGFRLARGGRRACRVWSARARGVWRARCAGEGTIGAGLGSRPSEQNRGRPEREGCGAGVARRSGLQNDRGKRRHRRRRQRRSGGRPCVRRRRPAGGGRGADRLGSPLAGHARG